MQATTPIAAGLVRRTCLLLAGLISCGGCSVDADLSGPEAPSEFLRGCVHGCASNLSCIAGVCTLPCNANDASESLCEALPSTARCLHAEGVSSAGSCEVVCSTDSQCAGVGEEFVCHAGLCRDGAPELPDSPPLVMVLLDTSGSMERLPGCECETPGCEECWPGCDVDERNRHAMAVEALTGTWERFECEQRGRTSELFDYDRGYYLPYHKPPVAQPQVGDGVLDEYRERVRFGLATFDGADTYRGEIPLVELDEYDILSSGGVDGLWSYGSVVDGKMRTRDDGFVVGSFQTPDENLQFMMDTGVRGPDARLGALRHSRDRGDMLEVNRLVQDDLPLVRPFGGTPTAAALDDLLFHFTGDPTQLGEFTDRPEDRHIVLITDGVPDDDYRGFGCNCAQELDVEDPGYCGGSPFASEAVHCPYPTAPEAARALVDAAVDDVHVIVFATDDSATGEAADKIAVAGGTGRAPRARDAADLRRALRNIIDGTL